MKTVPILIAMVVVCWTTSVVAQEDFRAAQQLHKECKQLQAKGNACRALKKCEAAAEARSSTRLLELTKEVREECQADKRARQRRAEDKKAAAESPDKTIQITPCPDGQEVTSDTAGNCCWPGQAWSNGRSVCIGVPACPEGFVRYGDETCETVATAETRDADGDGIPDFTDVCIAEAEDIDGFEDDDGCPETDNDGDGIVDSRDACPDEAEDIDGVDDADGCIDTADTAPPGSSAPPWAGPVGIAGWSIAGVGGAALLTALILEGTLLADSVALVEGEAHDMTEFKDAKNTIDTVRPVNQGLYIGGGLLLVGGITMGVIALLAQDSNEGEAVSFRLAPIWSVGGIGSALEVHW